MVEPVKPRRSYHSPRRQQQAAATRQAILEAAQRLFEQRGYPATTMEQVAAEAGVALKTVYVAFATKSGLLRAPGPAPQGDQDRASVATALVPGGVGNGPGARSCGGQRGQRPSGQGAQSAACSGPAVAAPVDTTPGAVAPDRTDFYDNQRTVVWPPSTPGARSGRLEVAGATDILWALNHTRRLAAAGRERGWTPEQWERWFADTACAQLLRGQHPSP